MTALSAGAIYKTICSGIIGQNSVAIIMGNDGKFLAYKFQEEPFKTFMGSNDETNLYVPISKKESESEEWILAKARHFMLGIFLL